MGCRPPFVVQLVQQPGEALHCFLIATRCALDGVIQLGYLLAVGIA